MDLAFSPDGEKLAVTMDNHYQDRDHKTHLFIVDLGGVEASFRRYDVETCGKFLSWAPDGGALLVCGLVLRLSDGSSCDLLQASGLQSTRELFETTFWLDSRRLIRADRTIADLSCQPAGNWDIPGIWSVARTLPANGWIVLNQTVNRSFEGKTFPNSNYAIADIDLRALLSGMLMEDVRQASGSVLAAEGAEAACSEYMPLVKSSGWTLRCWNLPDGEVMPISLELKDYKVTRASLSSPRVIAERWGSHWWNPFSEVPYLLRMIVVDLRSGRQIANLKPREQFQYSSVSYWDKHFQVALSPNGELLAEGGDGAVAFYGLP